MLSDPSVSVALPPRRFHAFTLFFDAGAFLRRALVPMFVVLLRAPVATEVILVVALAAMLASQIAVWLRRTYRIADGVLRVDEGVLRRRQRALPLDRIQQVDVHRTLRHRILGVATLRVETAGEASSPEVHLHVIGMGEVDDLRRLLLGRRLVGSAVAAEGGRTVVELGAGEVALAGMTGAHLGVMLTILFWPLQLLDDLPGNQFENLDPSGLSATGTQAIAGLLFLGPLWLGLAAIASLLRDAGFTMTRDGDEVVIRRGLLETREAHMALTRVQVVRISQSPLRRPLGMVAVRIQSAGASGDASRVSIPLLPAAALDRVLGELLPGSVPLPALKSPPRAARRRRRTRGLAGGVLASIPFLAPGMKSPLWLAAFPLLVGCGWLLAGGSYRALGHGLNERVVAARQGAIWRRTVVVPVAKVQSVRVQSSPFQRAAGLATTHLDVAPRGAVPTVVDESLAQARAVATAAVTRTTGPPR